MAQSAPKRTKLKLKTKRNVSSSATAHKHVEKSLPPEVNLSVTSECNDSVDLTRSPPTKTGLSDNRSSQIQSSKGNALMDVRQSITSLLPGYLGVDPSTWKTLARLPPTDIQERTTKASESVDIDFAGKTISWTALPKTCRSCARRKPYQTKPEIGHMKDNNDEPSDKIVHAIKKDITIESNNSTRDIHMMDCTEEVEDDDILIIPDPSSPTRSSSDDDIVRQEAAPAPVDLPGVSHCPLCNLNFNQGLSQIDIDGHIAACYAAADDDVTW